MDSEVTAVTAGYIYIQVIIIKTCTQSHSMMTEDCGILQVE